MNNGLLLGKGLLAEFFELVNVESIESETFGCLSYRDWKDSSTKRESGEPIDISDCNEEHQLNLIMTADYARRLANNLLDLADKIDKANHKEAK